jgi:hypothetical protein
MFAFLTVYSIHTSTHINTSTSKCRTSSTTTTYNTINTTTLMPLLSTGRLPNYEKVFFPLNLL